MFKMIDLRIWGRVMRVDWQHYGVLESHRVLAMWENRSRFFWYEGSVYTRKYGGGLWRLQHATHDVFFWE